jgi:sugar phosphate isomerase/epimerase
MPQAKPIAIQLYTVREACKTDYRSVLKAIADTGYVGIEIGGSFFGKTAREFRAYADGLGLQICAAHVGAYDPANREKIVAEARDLGLKRIVSGFGPAEFESVEATKAAAVKANAAVSYFKSQGLAVAYHNHEWEFKVPGVAEVFFDSTPELELELDIYWATLGGATPSDVIRRYLRRVTLLHIKDGPAQKANRSAPMTAVGVGRVDIPAAIRAGDYGNVEWNIVELDHCATDMLQAVKSSYDFLTQRGLARGNR